MDNEQVLKAFPSIDAWGIQLLQNIIEESSHFFNFQNSQRPEYLFEFSYAIYLADDNRDFLQTYKKVLLQACYHEFLEWYEYLCKNIFDPKVQAEFDLKIDVSEPQWVERWKASSVVGWAYQLKDEQEFSHHLDKALILGKKMSTFFNERSKPSTLDQDYFQSDHAQIVLDSIEHILIPSDDHKLREQLLSDDFLCIIDVFGWDNTFNPILMRWFHENQKTIKKWTQS
jgi:hypothetical protein